ncbi:MAG: DUF421 domain-containing protein [Oscillospiraceae bacterium]|nr:DUF421 domain-containing protein [Oscillospiraceae bacterium]
MIITLIRTVILYLVVVLILRIMGKRQIGELSPAELTITILISELAAIPMQDNAIPLLHGIVPILTLLAIELIVSTLSLKSRFLRKIIVGNASVLIENGTINQEEMHRLRLNLDELLEELRLCGHQSISTVEIAILEANGKLSVFPTDPPQSSGLPVTLISDGKLIPAALCRANKDKDWVMKQVKKHHLKDPAQVFLLQLDEDGTLTCVPKSKYL